MGKNKFVWVLAVTNPRSTAPKPCSAQLWASAPTVHPTIADDKGPTAPVCLCLKKWGEEPH